MAAEVTPRRDESGTIHLLEERLRTYLEERVGVRIRFADVPGARAFLVSAMRADDPKGLVVDRSASTGERVYLYLHAAAHIGLRHNVPLMTLVETRGIDDGDAALHERADAVVRAIWWGEAGERELRALLPGATAAPLRWALAAGPTRAVLRALLLALRRAYYAAPRRLLDRAGLTRPLREALWVTAVVSAAPQLATTRR